MSVAVGASLARQTAARARTLARRACPRNCSVTLVIARASSQPAHHLHGLRERRVVAPRTSSSPSRPGSDAPTIHVLNCDPSDASASASGAATDDAGGAASDFRAGALMGAAVQAPPQEGGRSAPPVLFVHGGFHTAHCWERFMRFGAAAGWDTHSLSVRFHGDSYHPGTAKDADRVDIDGWSDDIRAVAMDIAATHGQHPLLVGHSAGGGAVQRYLHREDEFAKHSGIEKLRCPGAVLLCAFPPRRGWRVFWNWWNIEGAKGPMVQSVLQRNNRLPLATEERFRAAMLTAGASGADVRRRIVDMESVIESSVVPAQLAMGRFVDVDKVRQHGTPIAVIGGAQDVLMTPQVVDDTADAYGVSPATIVETVAHDAMCDAGWKDAATAVFSKLRGMVAASA